MKPAQAKKKIEKEVVKDVEKVIGMDAEEDMPSSILNLNKSTVYYRNLQMAQSYDFKTFDPVRDLKQVNYNLNALIVAKSGSGKSVFVRDVIHQIKDKFTSAYVVCTTAHLQPKLYDFIDKRNVMLSFDEDKLTKLFDEQSARIIKLRDSGVKEEDMPRVLIIFDDVISDTSIRNSEILRRFYFSGRHILATTFFLLQTLSGISSDMRKNVRMAVGYYLENEKDRLAFAESYLSTENKRLGVMVYDNITKEKYMSVVILNYEVEKKNPENYIRTYLANPKVGDFKIGGGIGKNIPVSHYLDPVRSAAVENPINMKIRKPPQPRVRLGGF